MLDEDFYGVVPEALEILGDHKKFVRN
jgi:hypothetical protein